VILSNSRGATQMATVAMAISLLGMLWPLMALVIVFFALNITTVGCLQFRRHVLGWDFRSFVQEIVLIVKEEQKMLSAAGDEVLRQTPLEICHWTPLGKPCYWLHVWP